jgi:hypothetical protein
MIKKLFLAASILCMVVISSVAQQRGGTPEERAKRQTEMIKETTGIDAAKATKVEAILLKYAKEMATLREKTPDREARREPQKVLTDKQDAELKTVLTAEQFAKWTAKIEEMRKNRGQ